MGVDVGEGVGVGVGVGIMGVGEGVTVGTRVAFTNTVRGVAVAARSSVAGVQARMAMVSATRAAKAVIKLTLRNRGMDFIVVDGRVETMRRGPSNCYRIIDDFHDYIVAINHLASGRFLPLTPSFPQTSPYQRKDEEFVGETTIGDATGIANEPLTLKNLHELTKPDRSEGAF